MLARLVALALIALVATATGAMAHAGLIAADPAEGSVLAAAPAAVELTFTEPVAPIDFSIVGLDGVPVPLAPARVDGASVRVPLPNGLGTGSQLFSWRVTSADGHPVNGTIGFAIGAPSGPIAAAAGDPARAAAIWAVRALQYLALFLGVGSAAFGTLMPLPPAARRVSRAMSTAGLVLVVPAVALQGLDLLGQPPAALLTSAPWRDALAGSYGQTQALLAVAFALALLPGRATALAAGLAGALAPTLSGHASTAEPQALMRMAVFVHLLSLLFWLGALVPLFFILRGPDRAALHRFSRLVPWAVGALLVSGVTLALVQLGPPDADWFSAYGWLLAAKLVLVAVLLLLALWNRLRLTPRADAGAAQPLRRSILVELALVTLIVGVVAGWRFTPSPRVLAQIEAAAAPVTVPLTAAGNGGTLTAAPGRAGLVGLDIVLSAPAQSVTVLLDNTSRGIATITRQAAPHGNGHWQVDRLLLPAGGTWSVTVQARTGRFDMTTLTGILPLRGKDNDMRLSPLTAIAASSMLLAAPAAAADCPTGQSFTQGAITVTGAFARATPPRAPSAGGYLSIHNAGTDADTLLGVSSPAATDVSIHQMAMNGNVMEMSAVAGGLGVPAGSDVRLDPSGYHLMLTGLAQPLVEGQCVAMTLHFARAGDLPVTFNIGGYAQQVPPGASSMEMPAMDMSGMSSMPGM